MRGGSGARVRHVIDRRRNFHKPIYRGGKFLASSLQRRNARGSYLIFPRADRERWIFHFIFRSAARSFMQFSTFDRGLATKRN